MSLQVTAQEELQLVLEWCCTSSPVFGLELFPFPGHDREVFGYWTTHCPGCLTELPRGSRCSVKHGGSPVVPASSGAKAVFCVTVSLLPGDRGN